MKQTPKQSCTTTNEKKKQQQKGIHCYAFNMEHDWHSMVSYSQALLTKLYNAGQHKLDEQMMLTNKISKWRKTFPCFCGFTFSILFA